MEHLKCQCDKGYNSCKGEIKERNLKLDFQWDIKVKDYNLILCDYHHSVIYYMKPEMMRLLKDK